MFILNTEQIGEAPAEERPIQDWWARLWARFRRKAQTKAGTDGDQTKRARSADLLL